MTPTFQTGNQSSKKILAVSPITSYDGFNTSVHRVNALRELGHQVQVIDSAPPTKMRPMVSTIHRLQGFAFRRGLPINQSDFGETNKKLLNEVSSYKPDIIWLDKAIQTTAETLRKIKSISPQTILVGFSLDDMSQRHNQSAAFLTSLRHYDVFITNKFYNVEELKALGCSFVIFTDNGYDPNSFRPLVPSPQDVLRLGGDIGFIGTYEKQRALSLLALAKKGLSVRVWGSGWERCAFKQDNLILENRALRHDDFALACNSFKINLAFLRKINRDLQTTRSVELPACGGFMLAERTSEHCRLFKEGEEAEFFNGDAELIAKCEHYLAHENLRLKIAEAGLNRCRYGGYDWASRLRIILAQIDAHFKNVSSLAEQVS